MWLLLVKYYLLVVTYRWRPNSTCFVLLWICCTTSCATSCTTSPRQSIQQVHIDVKTFYS